MIGTYDELVAHAEQHQAELRREAEVRRLVRSLRPSAVLRTLASGRTLRIVPQARPWPSLTADEQTAA